MGLAPYENFKGFVFSRPPLVVFMICMGLFAVVLLSLAYYVKVHEIQNPDISEDWNVFLQSFADLELCLLGNSSDALTTTSPPHTTLGQKESTKLNGHTTAVPSLNTDHNLEYEGTRNYSVSLLLTIHPTRDFLSIPHNLTHISGSILGKQFGLTGPAGEELINVTAELPVEWNNTKCSPKYGGGCDPVKIYTCVHFQGPAQVFPNSRSPPTCENYNETGIEYHAKVRAQRVKSPFPTYYCRARPIIRVHYEMNPALTMFLSLHDRSVINLHLMHTSYFLFVMVITLLCYAMIRGKPSKMKGINDKNYAKMSNEA